jgi:hypothetical protein
MSVPPSLTAYERGTISFVRFQQELAWERLAVRAADDQQLIKTRFAYVSVSRAAQDVQIFTNAATSLETSLHHAVTKTSAVEMASGLGVWRRWP